MSTAAESVPRVAAAQLPPWEFKLQYMLRNLPVIITHLPLLHTAAQWVTAEGELNLAVLRSHFATTVVPVTDVSALYALSVPPCLSQTSCYLPITRGGG
jgi:hypothetical protein